MSTPPQVPGYPLSYATPPAAPPWRLGRGLIGWLLFVGVAALLFVWLKQQRPATHTIALSDFSDQLERANVSRVIVDGDELSGTLNAPRVIGGRMITNFRTYLPSGAGGSWPFTQWLLANRNGATIRAEPNNNLLTNFVLPFIPWLLILLCIWFFVFRQLRSQSNPTQPVPVMVVNPEGRR